MHAASNGRIHSIKNAPPTDIVATIPVTGTLLILGEQADPGSGTTPGLGLLVNDHHTTVVTPDRGDPPVVVTVNSIGTDLRAIDHVPVKDIPEAQTIMIFADGLAIPPDDHDRLTFHVHTQNQVAPR